MSMSYRKLFDLSGRTVLVTGGLGILGTHFCRGLAESGARVVIVDLEEEKAGRFAEELGSAWATEAIGLECDVSDEEAVQRAVAKAVERFGRIDVLVNNAASKSDDLAAFFSPVEDYSLQEWRKIMSVNLDGMFLVARTVGRHMISAGVSGSIIQTSSIYGVVASDKRIYEGSLYLGTQISNPVVYSASKAGVVGLSKYLAAVWADRGIRVNTLVPGGVRSGQNDTFVQRYSARVPLGRMAQPEEMVGAVLYLASDASSYVTGQCLIVDGGLTAW
jgi:NAD(P)-dependent dehydrogenase (short-subunit alcohol dehydrogenase family)